MIVVVVVVVLVVVVIPALTKGYAGNVLSASAIITSIKYFGFVIYHLAGCVLCFTILSSQNEIYDTGMEFFGCSQMTVTRRRKHLSRYFLVGSATFFDIYHPAVSKRDLKPFRICAFESLHATLDL